MISLEWRLWFWLILGVPLSIAWLLIIAILVRPQTRRGLAYWVLPVVALLVATPLLWLAGIKLDRLLQPAFYTLNRVTDTMASLWWVVPVLAALGGTGWLLWRYWPRGSVSENQPMTDILPAPVSVNEHAQPVAIWSLPDKYRGGGL